MTIKTGSIVDGRKIHFNRNLFTKLECGPSKEASRLQNWVRKLQQSNKIFIN